MQKFEFLDHPADLKIRAYGKTLPELFINSACAMMEFLYEVKNAEIVRVENIQVEAENLDSLLLNWLSEILCLSDTYRSAFIDLQIKELFAKKIIAKVAGVRSKKKMILKQLLILS